MAFDWQTSNDPVAMIEALDKKRMINESKGRLFLVAHCRKWMDCIPEGHFQNALQLSEDVALGVKGHHALNALHSVVLQQMAGPDKNPHSDFIEYCAATAVAPREGYRWEKAAYFKEVMGIGMRYADAAMRRDMADTLRDFFPNPQKPVLFDKKWLTGNVVNIASMIKNERAYGQLPILADALQDAGCDNAEVLNHCRHGNPPTASWVVSEVLQMAQGKQETRSRRLF